MLNALNGHALYPNPNPHPNPNPNPNANPVQARTLPDRAARHGVVMQGVLTLSLTLIASTLLTLTLTLSSCWPAAARCMG